MEHDIDKNCGRLHLWFLCIYVMKFRDRYQECNMKVMKTAKILPKYWHFHRQIYLKIPLNIEL